MNQMKNTIIGGLDGWPKEHKARFLNKSSETVTFKRRKAESSSYWRFTILY